MTVAQLMIILAAEPPDAEVLVNPLSDLTGYDGGAFVGKAVEFSTPSRLFLDVDAWDEPKGDKVR